MGRKNISQREAIALRKRVKELEAAERLRLSAYASEYPGGVNIDKIVMGVALVEERIAIRTAQMLGHVVICKLSGQDLLLFAVKQ